MTDGEFLLALEKCELQESDFGHAAHVRAAYLYLRSEGFAGALERTRRQDRRGGRPLRGHPAGIPVLKGDRQELVSVRDPVCGGVGAVDAEQRLPAATTVRGAR